MGLERGDVEEEGRRAALAPGGDGKGAGPAVGDVAAAVGFGEVGEAGIGWRVAEFGAEGRVAFGGGGGGDGVVGPGPEGGDLGFALGDEGERGGLDAADAEHALRGVGAAAQGEEAREVDAFEPVGARAQLGGVVEGLGAGAGKEVGVGLAQRVGGEALAPEPLDDGALRYAGMGDDFAGDEFAFHAGVGGDDDDVGGAEGGGGGLEFCGLAVLGDGRALPAGGDVGQGVERPFPEGGIVFVGRGELEEVALGGDGADAGNRLPERLRLAVLFGEVDGGGHGRYPFASGKWEVSERGKSDKEVGKGCRPQWEGDAAELSFGAGARMSSRTGMEASPRKREGRVPVVPGPGASSRT